MGPDFKLWFGSILWLQMSILHGNRIILINRSREVDDRSLVRLFRYLETFKRFSCFKRLNFLSIYPIQSYFFWITRAVELVENIGCRYGCARLRSNINQSACVDVFLLHFGNLILQIRMYVYDARVGLRVFCDTYEYE